MKLKALCAIASVAAVWGIAAIPATIASADTSCPSGNVCFWPQIDFMGQKVTSTGFYNQWAAMNATGSGKNAFTGRTVKIGNGQAPETVLECLNPGDQDHNFPNNAATFKVSDTGVRC